MTGFRNNDKSILYIQFLYCIGNATKYIVAFKGILKLYGSEQAKNDKNDEMIQE